MSRLNNVSGKLAGCDVKIFEEISSNHESPYLHTYMRFEPCPFNFEFEISRKSLGGKSNFESGDPSVDNLFNFLTNDAAQLQQLLNADVLDKLKLTHPFFGNGLLAETEKFEHYFMGGLTTEAQTAELEAILNVLTALIKARK